MFKIGLFILLLLILGALIHFGLLLRNSKNLFTQAEQFNRDYTIGTPSDPLFTYIVLGDSTALGVGASQENKSYPYLLAKRISTQGKLVRVVVLAQSGAKMQDVATGQLGILNSLHPDLITLSIGANDATHFSSLSSYQDSLQKVLSALKKTKAQVLFANTPDVSQTPALPLPYALLAGKRAEQQNKLLEKSIQGSSIKEVDLFKQARLPRNQVSNYASDQFHPSDQGYTVWAQEFEKTI